jgi:hypothetical protein
LPLIRILKYAKNNNEYSYFIEPTGQVYDGWTDFIDKNNLPECHICYPKSEMEEIVFILSNEKISFQMAGTHLIAMVIAICVLENRPIAARRFN